QRDLHHHLIAALGEVIDIVCLQLVFAEEELQRPQRMRFSRVVAANDGRERAKANFFQPGEGAIILHAHAMHSHRVFLLMTAGLSEDGGFASCASTSIVGSPPGWVKRAGASGAPV